MTEPSSRIQVKRAADRGVYDRRTVDRILDGALFCHVGFIDQGQPFVIPTLHVRVHDHVYIHGSLASRMIRCLHGGAPACLTVTLLDGLVLARSAFHHSANYRSVVILGSAEEIADRSEKLDVLYALSEHVIPGRWNEVRKPSDAELNQTAVLGFGLNECSAKIRTGPPVDDEADYDLPVWAGVLPFVLTTGTPEMDPKDKHGLPVPAYIANYRISNA